MPYIDWSKYQNGATIEIFQNGEWMDATHMSDSNSPNAILELHQLWEYYLGVFPSRIVWE